ncbi:hypothetical protein [Parasitella parasitica]|uniref:Kelch repeat protein n=1 Tax=Parasitella parasitica TaxID=35722 RepID=A0A0B7N3U0_9FUNG|nr:hypothetical protein [Parasitella parasitica]
MGNCAADLISIANYTGKHDSRCFEAKTVAGAIVNKKLYTFGGCFRVSYVVDPDTFDDNFIFRSEEHKNATDLSQVYDILKDEWSFETKTPVPFKQASTQVVNQSIYFYNVRPEFGWTSMEMYKYDTNTKIWTMLPDIPFLWSENLKSCYDGQGRMYFTGSEDGLDRNIIHVYDTRKEQWIKIPIFMDKRLQIKQMICKQDHIKFIAKDLKNIEDEPTTTVWYSIDDGPPIMDETLGLFSMSYHDGSTVSDNYSFDGNYNNEPMAYYGDYAYLFNVRRTETIFYRLNVMTRENVTIATLPYDLSAPLIVPVNENELLILGGIESNFYRKTHKNDIKRYNHKLVYNPSKHDEL